MQLLHSYNEETGESDETGEDDKAVDNEVEECVWVQGCRKAVSLISGILDT